MQTIYHGGAEKTEILVTHLAANPIKRTDHRMLIRSVSSVPPW